jgi:thermitase
MIEKGRLLIGFQENVHVHSKESIHRQLGLKFIMRIPSLNVDLVEVPSEKEEKYRRLYLALKEVAYVDFNYIRKPNYIPNDPFYLKPTETTNDGLESQWGLRRLKPESAFERVKRLRRKSKIAILDTGIDKHHPDLFAKIVDPINVGADGPSHDYIDNDGHGTHVAGIAAAITDNRIGIVGTSFNTANIIPIKLGDEVFTSVAIITGILYAIEKEADVINMSLGGPSYSQAEQNVIELAWSRGIILVAAAGNEGHDSPSYPAAYNYVLGVSATDKHNQLASFSNWGVYVGIAAPGTEILSTTPTYPLPKLLLNYDSMQGTSMAAPFVSGVAVMLRAINPQATNQDIIQAIQESAKILGVVQKEWNPFYGYGLLNASEAVRKLLEPKRRFNKTSPPLGSFYGQVVDSNNHPVENLRIVVWNQSSGEDVREYVTKNDGMFRLFNLVPGNYTIGYVDPENNEPILLNESTTIIPGGDVFLKYVINEL